MIVVEKLTKRYGSRVAVDDVSFEVARGEIVGFLGPNGAGKSTTLRMITGFLAPTEGHVRIDGIDVHSDPVKARARFGYLPEGVPLYAEMRVSEYLEHRARLKGVSGKHARKEAEKALSLAGVSDALPRIVGQLSKGYRQRVGLADALLGDPPLLILDEPTSGLDPNQMRHVRELVKSFAGKKTVFLSTHILPEVEASCERVVIIKQGRKVAEGVPSTLRTTAEGKQVVRLAGPGEAEAFERALDGLGAVRGISVDKAAPAGTVRLAITTEPGDEAIDAIFRSVVAAGLGLRELSREQVALEDVFAELTTEEETVAQSGTEAP